MGERSRRPRKCWLPWFIFSLIVVAIGTAPARAQNATESPRPHIAEPADLLKNCPLGHLIEFELPTTKLYLDLHWLGSKSIINLFNAQGAECPTSPIEVRSLDFERGVLRFLDTSSGLGQKLIRMYVGGAISESHGALTRRPKPNRDTASAQAWIEDLTLKPPLKGQYGPGTSRPDSRWYELHYPGDTQNSIELSCGGGGNSPVLRTCGTIRRYNYGGLGISYLVSQTQLPIPDLSHSASKSVDTEPGALLQFDTRLRAWLDRIQQRQ